MPNIFINNQNLGPVIDVKELPTTDINPNAIYRLVKQRYDIVDGHGKDSTIAPVGYYKPAEGTSWSANYVNRGSYGEAFDGYYDCPVARMRRGTQDVNWDPVHCEPEESSGIFYYDTVLDQCYFKHNTVGVGGVNFYSETDLERDVGTIYLGLYMYNSGSWIQIGHDEECTFLGVIDTSVGTLEKAYVTKVGEKTYYIAGTFTLNKTLSVDGHKVFTNFAVGPTAKYAVCQQSGSANMDPWTIPATFMVMPTGEMWLRPASAMERVGGRVSFSITMTVA